VTGTRYRNIVPLARTKWDAEQAEIAAKKELFEKRFGAEEKGLIWKDLRATFGTRLAEAGCDAFTIAQLGWTFRHSSDDALRACR